MPVVNLPCLEGQVCESESTTVKPAVRIATSVTRSSSRSMKTSSSSPVATPETARAIPTLPIIDPSSEGKALRAEISSSSTNTTTNKSSPSAAAIVVPFLVALCIFACLLTFYYYRRYQQRRLAASGSNSKNKEKYIGSQTPLTPGRRMRAWFETIASPTRQPPMPVTVVDIKKPRETRKGSDMVKERKRKDSGEDLTVEVKEVKTEMKRRVKQPPVIDLRAAIEAGRKAAKAADEKAKRQEAERAAALTSKSTQKKSSKRSKATPAPVIPVHVPIKKSLEKDLDTNENDEMDPNAADNWRGPQTASTATSFCNDGENKSRHVTQASSFYCAGLPSTRNSTADAIPVPPLPITAEEDIAASSYEASSFFSDTSLPYRRASTVFSDAEIKSAKTVKLTSAKLVVPPLPKSKSMERKRASVESSVGSVRGPPNTVVSVVREEKEDE